MRYTGEQYELRAGSYAAIVTEGGARLRSLTFDGRPLVASFGADALPPVSRGAVLAPWPNRIADGRYSFAGQPHQLPINEPSRMTALHGLVAWAPWTLAQQSNDAATLRCRIWPTDGYPFLLDLEIAYLLTADGLTIRLSAVNAGDRNAPYGCSIHPYLVAGPGRIDEWTLRLPAHDYLDVDELRLLPVGVRPVEGTQFDFRTPTQIGARQIDHAMAGLEFDADGRCSAQLLHRDGRGVEMSWDSGCRWVQLHTADRPEPELDRAGLAFEPMTCPPNAFASSEGLIELPPGESTTTSWVISAL
jgi:aldose 1-epimerase